MSTGPAMSVGEQGLSKVSHAIRRSTALYTAMMVSPDGTTDDQLLARADLFALWLAGTAGVTHVEHHGSGGDFMGENPWEGSTQDR